MRRAKIVCTLGPAVEGAHAGARRRRHGRRPLQPQPRCLRRAPEALPRRCARPATRPGRAVGVLVDLQGPKIRLGRFADGPGRARRTAPRSPSRPGTCPATSAIASTTYTGLPEDARVGDVILVDDGKVAPAGDAIEGQDVDDPRSRSAARSRTTRASTCPASAMSVPAMSDKDEADLRWALHLRADLIALSFVRERRRHRRRAQDHGGGGGPAPRHRQDREAAGGRQPRGDRPGVRRDHGRPRRPRRRAAAGAGADGAEVRRRAGPPGGQARHRGHPGARLDDLHAAPDPRRGLRLRQRRARRRGRRDAVRRDERGQVRARVACGRWRGSSRPPRTRGWSGSPRSAPGRHQGRGGHVRGGRRWATCSTCQFLVAFTQSGDSARRMSRLRSRIPLLAFTPDPAVRSQLALSWGVETFLTEPVAHTDDMVKQVDEALLSIGPVPARRAGRHRGGVAARDPRVAERDARAPDGRRRRGLAPAYQ